MIHRFSVSNYHSVREEVVIDLRIPGTAPALPGLRHSAATPGVRLPAVVVLMGPNGSGKTTLLRALVSAADIASSAPLAKNNPLSLVTPFLSGGYAAEPTRIWVEFEADGLTSEGKPELFRYEFSIERRAEGAVEKSEFCHEALLHFPKGRPRRLFERSEPGQPIYASREIGLRARDERLKAVRADASVISTLAMLNVPLAARIVEWLQNFLTWSTNIVAYDTWSFDTNTIISMIENNPDRLEWIRSRIQCSDLGIQDVKIAELADGEKFVLFEHEGLDERIHIHFESSGTKRLFHLLPQIDVALRSTGLAVLDEIDGDLHVDIVGEVLSWFRSRETNPRDAQLLITSHHVGLLDDLEKEEVFFVEKDDSGVTRVHGAQDVRGLRRDTRLYAKYRGGVLGGLPRIG